MNLLKISPELEDTLARARLLAEQRRQAFITPAHLLYVLLDEGGPLAAVIERSGVSAKQLQEAAAARLNEETSRLEPGRRPTASRAVRELIEAAIHRTEERGASRAEPLDALLALLDSGQQPLRRVMQEAGLTADSVRRLAEAQRDAREVLGEPAAPAARGGSSMLERFARDLTRVAAAGELMPVIGRDNEVRRVIQTLLRKTKNNPVLVGDPGTGKTAVVEGLAIRVAAGDVPESLKRCRVLALDLTAMVAGAKYRGEFEERIRGVVEEVRAAKGEIILFLDELHTLVGAGATEGGMDAANILKPALARGELRCIGATTFDEYRERIEKDGALARRFDVVTIKEPDDEGMIAILRGIRPRYETYHGVRLTEESLHAAIKLSRRYIRDRFLPDKAIDVIDEATARIRMQKESRPVEVDRMERMLVRKQAELATLSPADPAAAVLRAEIDQLAPQTAALVQQWRGQKEASDKLQKTREAIAAEESRLAAAESNGDVARAAEIRYGSLKYLEQQRQDLEQRVADLVDSRMVPDMVSPENIAEVIAERVGIPIQRMLEGERERMLKLEERIGARVFGQDAAVAAVAEACRRMRVDLRIGRRPNSFLFVGPTGTGKTELAKALAEALFDDEHALIRIDMAEYKDRSSVAGLIGSRPGLVGSDEGGFLTEHVRRSPYSVVLFDEIEKAHPEVLDLLLGVLDDGRLTDAKGRLCDFSSATVIFTSNIGVREANELATDPEDRKQIVLEAVKATLRPEFLNRIAQVIVFNSLEPEHLHRIVRTHLDAIIRQLADERQIGISASAAAVDYLASVSYVPEYGARPIARNLQDLVLSPLATAILSGEAVAGQTICIDYNEHDGLMVREEVVAAIGS